jgi:Domain of unknown function (DUF222)
VAAEGDGWKATGATSASHWLAAAAGSSVTKARSAVALGKSLKACPELAAKVVACAISPENARVLGRAIGKPVFELDKAELLKAAERLSPAKLNNEIDQWLAMVDGPGEKEREARAHAARSLRFSATADGMVRATALLTNEAAKVGSRPSAISPGSSASMKRAARPSSETPMRSPTYALPMRQVICRVGVSVRSS